MWLFDLLDPSSYCLMRQSHTGTVLSLPGGMLPLPFLSLPIYWAFQTVRCGFPVMLQLNLFSPVLSAKFISACEQCLHRENCASIIGMPLVFPWALGLRTLASLGAMSFVQMRSWSLCVPDTVALGVQGSLPAQILSRNVLMSGSSCVLPAHASRRHPALLRAAHSSLAFSSRQCYLMGRLTSVSMGASEHSDAAQDVWILSPVGPLFQGSGCNSFASYVRSQCHFPAPLILSPPHPSTGAEVAAPVLKESVSVSPGTHLLWTAWWYLFQLKKVTKTFCPHRSKDFCV